ncbi:hypothetical protein C8Q76DRAFT_96261 [Earliella scabrosa]|nr:hypothetical protein C8Q76DRAFT_96261 [Earliella scabrosa]
MSSPIRALSPGSSLASYDFFSHSRAMSSGESDDGSYGTVSDDVSSDDEVLLSFSDLSSADFLSQRGARTPALFSDDEFVLMSRPRSPDSDDLTTSFSALSLSQASLPSHRRVGSGSSSNTDGGVKGASPNGKRRNKKRRAAQGPGNSVATDAASTKAESSPENPKHHSPSKARRKARRAAARAAAGSPSPAPMAGLGDRPIVDDVSEVGSEAPYVHPELYESAQRYVSSYVLRSFICCR